MQTLKSRKTWKISHEWVDKYLVKQEACMRSEAERNDIELFLMPGALLCYREISRINVEQPLVLETYLNHITGHLLGLKVSR